MTGIILLYYYHSTAVVLHFPSTQINKPINQSINRSIDRSIKTRWCYMSPANQRPLILLEHRRISNRNRKRKREDESESGYLRAKFRLCWSVWR